MNELSYKEMGVMKGTEGLQWFVVCGRPLTYRQLQWANERTRNGWISGL